MIQNNIKKLLIRPVSYFSILVLAGCSQMGKHMGMQQPIENKDENQEQKVEHTERVKDVNSKIRYIINLISTTHKGDTNLWKELATSVGGIDQSMIVNLLKSSGLDLNFCYFDHPISFRLHKYTFLIWAVENGYEGLVKILLDSGASPNIDNTVIGGAGDRRFIPVKYLDDSDPCILPLILAIEKGHVNIVRMLLDVGAKPNVDEYFKDDASMKGFPKLNILGDRISHYTPLMLAIVKQRIDIVKMLLEAGADPHTVE